MCPREMACPLRERGGGLKMQRFDFSLLNPTASPTDQIRLAWTYVQRFSRARSFW